jgi:hypothetical protein
MVKEKKTPILVQWDWCRIAEDTVKYRLEEDNEDGKSEEDIRDEVYSDSDLASMEWEEMIDTLTEIIERRNPDGRWLCEVRNFGWRHQNGHRYFKAYDGKEFLNKILPKTDCTFFIHNDGSGFSIQNYHHDSPMGNEWYHVRPVGEKEWEEKVRY